MKTRLFFFCSLLLLFVGSCELDPVNDPNNPSTGGLTSDASKAELQVLVAGLESRHRNYYGNATQSFGSFGREVWAFFGSDPRFIDEWLAIGITETYPDFFNTAGTYVSPYLAVKQANVLIAAANNSTSLTAQEASGYTGLANTVKGFQLLWPLLQQFDNGIRVDVEEPLNPGPILSYDEALRAIRQIIDEGNGQLASADIAFDLTIGFNGINLQEFNRAVAAKAAMYAGDWAGMITALDASYMDLNASDEAGLNAGPSHPYGNAPDVSNPLFYPFDASTNTILIVHPSMIEDALPNDGRLAKFAQRMDNVVTTETVNSLVLTGEYQDARWDGPTASISYLRNEELMLMYAEAKAQINNGNDLQDAVDIVNTIRNIWGVGDYAGAMTQGAVIDEILFQRRYSLWGEAGQRWLDMRRYNRLDDANIDLRDGGNIFSKVSRRISEISWEEG